MSYNHLGFAFSGLRTISFAVIEKSYRKSGKVNLDSNLSFGLDVKNNAVTCNVKFAFEKKEDQPFLIIEVQSTFLIKEEDFISIIKQGEHKFNLPKELAIHFAMLTIGATRGILHAKTEGTQFNEFLLPTIDIGSVVLEDIVFEL